MEPWKQAIEGHMITGNSANLAFGYLFDFTVHFVTGAMYFTNVPLYFHESLAFSIFPVLKRTIGYDSMCN